MLSFQQLLASQKPHRRFGLFHGEPWLGRSQSDSRPSRGSTWLPKGSEHDPILR